MNPEVAVSHYVLGLLSPEMIWELSDSWLQEGIYTDSLNFINHEKGSNSAVLGPLFEKLPNELGFSYPDKYTAARILTANTIKQMLAGTVGLLAGAEFIYWKVHHGIVDIHPDQEYLGDNIGAEDMFCWLREIWDCRDGSMLLYYSDLPREQAEKKYFTHLEEAAATWLEKYA